MCQLVDEKRYWKCWTQAGSHAGATGASCNAPVLKMSRSFKNGVIDGLELLYTRIGTVFTFRSFKSGLLHGLLQQFRDDGSLVYAEPPSHAQKM